MRHVLVLRLDHRRPPGGHQQGRLHASGRDAREGDDRRSAPALDATFNAGLNSGTQYEWEDAANRLHFYVVDLRKDANGILHYTVAVRSLDGAGPQTRGVALQALRRAPVAPGEWSTCTFALRNTGAAAATRRRRCTRRTRTRCSAATSTGSRPRRPARAGRRSSKNALAAVKFGETANVPVYVARAAGAAQPAR